MNVERIIQFFPLTAFIWTSRATNNWTTSFIVGGILATAQIIVFILKKYSLERFILAVNLFLIGGAIGLGFHISFIENFYDHFEQAALFIFLLCVGVFTTLFSKKGFINAQCLDQHHVRMYSLYLIVAVGLATAVSYYFKTNFFLGAGLPFLFLIMLRGELEKLCKSDDTRLL